MPIHGREDSQGTYYQWGDHGAHYYYETGDKSARDAEHELAQKQAAAAYANGYTGGDPLHFLNEPVCYADVYEIDSEDTYAECRASAAKFGFYSIIAVFIVVIIVLIALQQWQALLPAFIVGGLVVLIAAINAFWFAEWRARRAHRAAAYEIDQTLASHDGEISRGEAINIIRQERLQREQAASRLQAAQIQAQAQYGIASALRG